MNTQQKLISARYIADHLNQEHAWGTIDCCTVFLGWHDRVWGTDKQRDVVDNYNSRRGAIEFYKRMKLSWRQWLHINKYEQLVPLQRVTEGDIAVLDHRLFPTVYIYHNGAFWTMSEDRDFISIDKDSMRKHDNVTIWRHI